MWHTSIFEETNEENVEGELNLGELISWATVNSAQERADIENGDSMLGFEITLNDLVSLRANQMRGIPNNSIPEGLIGSQFLHNFEIDAEFPQRKD